jgi:hypothetical protein
MTQKDFILIQDAINEGCRDAINDICEGKEGYAPVTTSMAKIATRLEHRLGHAFAQKLLYTNDKFDSAEFKKKLNLFGK